jgi:dolichol-phosphate mannosyltransferase
MINHIEIDLSVVSPVYNEEQVLEAFCDQLTQVLSSLDITYEIILVDDGSSDQSPAIIAKRCEADPSVKAIHLARNFGQQAALTAGIEAALGRAVVTMDADLQHPPQELPRMVAAWKQGNALIAMERDVTKRISLVKRTGTALFYFFLNRWSEIPLGHNMPDFRLMDRAVVDRFKEFPERNRFIRGLVNWLGFKPLVLHFSAPADQKEQTNYSFRKMAHLAMDALTSFTAFPLRVALYSGLVVSLFSAAYLLYTLYVALFLDTAVKGWASLISVILFLGGCQMVFLGIIGEYLFRIYTEVKRRPIYIVKQTRNV